MWGSKTTDSMTQGFAEGWVWSRSGGLWKPLRVEDGPEARNLICGEGIHP